MEDFKCKENIDFKYLYIILTNKRQKITEETLINIKKVVIENSIRFKLENYPHNEVKDKYESLNCEINLFSYILSYCQYDNYTYENEFELYNKGSYTNYKQIDNKYFNDIILELIRILFHYTE